MHLVTLAALTFVSLTLLTCGGGDSRNGQPENGPPILTQLVQKGYLKGSNTEAGDWFGTNIAVDGDTLVVGARFEDSAATGIDGNQTDNSAPNSGAVYVFTRTGGVWSQQAYVKASNTGARDWFCIVALAGDTLVVGATQEDSAATGIDRNSAPDSGAVYVFHPQ